MEIKALTGIRGFAAMWVFFLHAMWGREGSYLEKLASFGGSGVITFFVLSGFIMSLNYDGKDFTYGEFIRARLARVYPLHLVTLLATAWLASLGYVEITSEDGPYTFALNLMLVQSWGFTPSVSWNQPAWSISHEFFAYLLFPIFIGLLLRARAWQVAFASLILAYLCNGGVSIPFALAHQYGLIGEVTQFAYGESLVKFFLMFVVGCVSYRVSKKMRPGKVISDILVVTGIALLAYSTLVHDEVIPETTVILASVLIIIGLRDNHGLGKMVFGNPIAHFVGKISFALYLSAPMVEYTLRHFVYPLPLDDNIAASVVVATILHYFIEKPAQRLIRQKRTHRVLAVG